MAIDFDEDLDEVLSTDDHGIKYTVGGTDYEGIFNNEFLDSKAGESGISSATPVLYAKTSDVAAAGISDGSTLTINSVVYTVLAPENDGQGLTMLPLRL